MGFNLNGLPAYVEQNRQELIAKSIFGAKSISLANIQTGIKGSETINIVDQDVYFQSGATCGFSASGSTIMTQRTITVGKLKVNDQWCYKELEGKYTQVMLREGSKYENPEDFDAFEAIANRTAEQIAKAMELAVWQSRLANNATNLPNLARFDGWNEILDAASGLTVNGNPGSVTAVTSANVLTVIDTMYGLVPEDILSADDLELRMGWDVFRTLQLKLRDNNLFHYDGVQYAAGELVYPGTNIKVIALHGLTGTGRMYIARANNWYYGTDMENEEEDFSVWFSQDDRVTKLAAEWKAGCQVAFPEQVVRFKLA